MGRDGLNEDEMATRFEYERDLKEHYRCRPAFLGDGIWRRFGGGDGRIMDDLFVRLVDGQVVLIEAKLSLQGDQRMDKPGSITRKLRRAAAKWRIDEHEALRVAVRREDKTTRRFEIDAGVAGGWSRAWRQPPIFYVVCQGATDTARTSLADVAQEHVAGPERWLAAAHLAIGPDEDGRWEVLHLNAPR